MVKNINDRGLYRLILQLQKESMKIPAMRSGHLQRHQSAFDSVLYEFGFGMEI